MSKKQVRINKNNLIEYSYYEPELLKSDQHFFSLERLIKNENVVKEYRLTITITSFIGLVTVHCKKRKRRGERE